MIAINFAWFDQKKTSPALVFFNANYHLANCCLAICKLSDQLLTEPEGLSICYDSNDDCY